jgi:hypothetical protein
VPLGGTVGSTSALMNSEPTAETVGIWQQIESLRPAQNEPKEGPF